MIVYPCAKINLGLNIVSRRPDGYHNLETVFYPIPLSDTLEVSELPPSLKSGHTCQLSLSGNTLEGKTEDNLVVKAYRLLAEHYTLPPIQVHLHKEIPSQAGLGGGSSDAAYMILILNEMFQLGLDYHQMEEYAARLGADCAFFIQSQPAYATGIGDQLTLFDNETISLEGYYMAIVKPDIAVSTQEAYARINPQKPAECCKDIILQSVDKWKDSLSNDFEIPIFASYPQIRHIKESLYGKGALYAQMSGSGSAVFAIFRNHPQDIATAYKDCFTSVFQL